ncbi:MAG: nuclear transport factor 2 family protein [Bdellovibrionales bacterium]|nr:nuclear transport factor 2 family protein [Bdellovibrionales bacterium]
MNKERMVELAQGQLDAYNKRDLETFCSFYHPEIQVFKMAENIRTCFGMEEFKKIYFSRFDNSPELHCELRSRVILNDTILDEEWVTGGGPTPSHVVAAYSFKDNLISHVWFIR